MLSPRYLNRIATIATLVLFIAVACMGLLYAEKEKGPNDEKSFIRADRVNPELGDLMDDIGVKARSISFRAPEGHDAIIRIIARDKTGNVLPSIARRHIFHDEPGQSNACTVRLAKIDPSALNDGYKGKIRWTVSYRHLAGGVGPLTVSSDEWSPNWFAEDGCSTS